MTEAGTRPGTVVMLPGSRWDDVVGTDRQLAAALGRQVPVLWVDPPYPVVSRSGFGSLRGGVDSVSPGVTRLRLPGLPGAAHRTVDVVNGRWVARQVGGWLRRLDVTPAFTVLASPRVRFSAFVAGTKVLFVTDDWAAGASLMGLSRRSVVEVLEHNVSAADLVVAVTPDLLNLTVPDGGAQVLANGCDPRPAGPGPRVATAGLVGQLNERLDLDLLEAIVDAGLPLEVVGPRTDRDRAFGARLDAVLGADSVIWHGAVPYDDVPHHLARFAVGLTPYADNDFNRASFPLKTLEYLAAGVSVVSSDNPSVRWLDTDLIRVTVGPADFVAAVRSALHDPGGAADEHARRVFAAHHSWDARATELRTMVSALSPERGLLPR